MNLMLDCPVFGKDTVSQDIPGRSSYDGLNHIPVLLRETIDFLDLSQGKIVVDCTFGGGGHSREIIKKILPGGKLLAIEQDREAINAVSPFFKDFSSDFTLVKGNFSDLDKILGSFGISEVDAFLFDLGISSFQLGEKNRGFSFQLNGPLDMRMDRDNTVTAGYLVNNYSEKDLADIIYKYGEETKSRQIAKELVKEREKAEISTTVKLAEIIAKVLKRKGKGSKIHPATRTFMAFRIFINKELEALEKGLKKAFEHLREGGRMVVITFHSLEDRIVKNYFKYLTRKCRCPEELIFCVCGGKSLARLINKKPVIPSEEEIYKNPRARSARIRVIEKIHSVKLKND